MPRTGIKLISCGMRSTIGHNFNAVEAKFGVDDHRQLMTALINLKQKGTVSEYCTEFQELMFKLCGHNPYYAETMFVGHFLRGLKQDISNAVASQLPDTVDRAIFC
jgi:hypothetical protein